MSFANPTALKIGMTGALYGQQFRVAGRSVMGVVVDGQTYYWNEFNIVNQQNQSGTLVYEVTESGPEGEDVGDVAHYFNAQAGDQMLVASWTGDDIEFYRGMELARGLVAEAFHLPQEPKEGLEETGGDSGRESFEFI